MHTDPVPDLLSRATELLEAEFSALPAFETASDLDAMARVLNETAHRLGDNYPYFHPLYAGQMLKPPHPVARAAYALAMTINPNNHARDGGRASSEMEIEAVRQIAALFGWSEFLGHLTSSGTFANLEALWIAGQLAPGTRIVGSEQAHYTHQRISAVLKLDFTSIPTNRHGRMSLEALEAELRHGDVGTVVVTMGTTAIGAVDPLDEILALRQKYGFRVHVDAAYGGYFRLIPEALDSPARRAYAVLDQADSIVVDPHKHGLQPYGCGCILFRDPSVGRFYKHDSPYTYFTSDKLHLGEISLECSRAGAAAVAFGLRCSSCRSFPAGNLPVVSRVAVPRLSSSTGGSRDRTGALSRLLAAQNWILWCGRSKRETNEQSSELAQRIFAACAASGFALALVQLPVAWFQPGAERRAARHGDLYAFGADEAGA